VSGVRLPQQKHEYEKTPAVLPSSADGGQNTKVEEELDTVDVGEKELDTVDVGEKDNRNTPQPAAAVVVVADEYEEDRQRPNEPYIKWRIRLQLNQQRRRREALAAMLEEREKEAAAVASFPMYSAEEQEQRRRRSEMLEELEEVHRTTSSPQPGTSGLSAQSSQPGTSRVVSESVCVLQVVFHIIACYSTRLLNTIC
jgi:hypothetical protein